MNLTLNNYFHQVFFCIVSFQKYQITLIVSTEAPLEVCWEVGGRYQGFEKTWTCVEQSSNFPVTGNPDYYT